MSRKADTPQSAAGKEIFKALEKIEQRGRSRDHIFRDWLDLMLSAYLSATEQMRTTGTIVEGADNPHEKRYLEIVQSYPSNEPMGQRVIDRFVEAHVALAKGIANGEPDPLGDLYMAAISYGEHGQFFTPHHIASAMAAMVGVQDGQRVLDPACGSGTILLMAAKQAPGALFYGIDLDERCAKMCAINLLLRGLSGGVQWGNALTYETYKQWNISDGWITEVDDPAPWNAEAQGP
jgi:type I restriction-modification system DNA methylase subunit